MKNNLKLILIGGIGLGLPLTSEIVHSFFEGLSATNFHGLTIAQREYSNRHDHSEEKTELGKINFELYGATGGTRDVSQTGRARIIT